MRDLKKLKILCYSSHWGGIYKFIFPLLESRVNLVTCQINRIQWRLGNRKSCSFNLGLMGHSPFEPSQKKCSNLETLMENPEGHFESTTDSVKRLSFSNIGVFFFFPQAFPFNSYSLHLSASIHACHPPFPLGHLT